MSELPKESSVPGVKAVLTEEYAAANGAPLLQQWRWSGGWAVGAPEEAEK